MNQRDAETGSNITRFSLSLCHFVVKVVLSEIAIAEKARVTKDFTFGLLAGKAASGLKEGLLARTRTYPGILQS